MDSKKILIIGGAIVVLIILAIVLSRVFGGSPGSVGTTATEVSTTGLNEPPSPSTFPTSTMLAIGTTKGIVEMNNFYTTEVSYDEGTLIFKQTPDYSLTYNTANSSFWIDITAGDPPTEEKAAEADLLSKLGITQAEACELNASWSVEYSVDPSMAGQDYPLTFCSTP